MSHLANKLKEKLMKYSRRKNRINKKIKSRKPENRIVINKSNLYISAQVINKNWEVLALITDKKFKGKTKTERAFSAGEELANIIKTKNLSKLVFDRNWYLYHGRIKAFAEWLRKWGVKL